MGTIVIVSWHMRKLRLKKIQYLPQTTQLESGEARISTWVSTWIFLFPLIQMSSSGNFFTFFKSLLLREDYLGQPPSAACVLKLPLATLLSFSITTSFWSIPYLYYVYCLSPGARSVHGDSHPYLLIFSPGSPESETLPSICKALDMCLLALTLEPQL